jgi:hypothetical protein
MRQARIVGRVLSALVLAATGTNGNLARADDTLCFYAGAYKSLADALNALGSQQATLVIGKLQTVTANVNVPSTITLVFTGSGQVSVSTSATLAIGGPVEAPPRQVFTGNGTVKISPRSGARVNPIWWGADNTGVKDSAPAFQAALNSALQGGCVECTPGLYRIAQTLVIPITTRGLRIKGNGCTLDGYVNGNTIQISDLTTANNCAQDIIIEDIRIAGRGPTEATTYADQNGIEVDAILGLTLRDVSILDIPHDGFIGHKSPALHSAYWNVVRFYNVQIRFTGFHALVVGDDKYGEGDDLEVYGSIFNNAGKRLLGPSSAGDGGVFVNVGTLTVSGTEISAMRGDHPGDGFLNALYVRHATGLISSTHFEANGNNLPGSADIFLDTDASNLVVSGTSHSCNQSNAAKVGIKSGSADVVILGAQMAGGSTHVFDYLVDVNRPGAKRNRVIGVGYGTFAPPALGLVNWGLDRDGGSVTLSGTSDSAGVTFAAPEVDTSYGLVVTPGALGGTPATGSSRIASITKTTTGFALRTEMAPGSGSSVTFDWNIVRKQ